MLVCLFIFQSYATSLGFSTFWSVSGGNIIIIRGLLFNYPEFSPVSNQLPKPTFSQISSPPLPWHTHVKIATFSSTFLSKCPHCLALSFKPSKDSAFYYHFKSLEQFCFLISFQLLFFFLMTVIICHALLILQNGAGGLRKKKVYLMGGHFSLGDSPFQNVYVFLFCTVGKNFWDFMQDRETISRCFVRSLVSCPNQAIHRLAGIETPCYKPPSKVS